MTNEYLQEVFKSMSLSSEDNMIVVDMLNSVTKLIFQNGTKLVTKIVPADELRYARDTIAEAIAELHGR